MLLIFPENRAHLFFNPQWLQFNTTAATYLFPPHHQKVNTFKNLTECTILWKHHLELRATSCGEKNPLAWKNLPSFPKSTEAYEQPLLKCRSGLMAASHETKDPTCQKTNRLEFPPPYCFPPDTLVLPKEELGVFCLMEKLRGIEGGGILLSQGRLDGKCTAGVCAGWEKDCFTPSEAGMVSGPRRGSNGGRMLAERDWKPE